MEYMKGEVVRRGRPTTIEVTRNGDHIVLDLDPMPFLEKRLMLEPFQTEILIQQLKEALHPNQVTHGT